MSSSLLINISNDATSTIVTLSGRIDEDSHFDAITSSSADVFIFDFENVTLINSCGVREWINLVNTIIKKSKIIYRHCPQIMIEQMNMVQGFLPEGATIESFYAPYFDPDQDKEVKILISLSEVTGKKAPVKNNEKGTELEFDALEAQYFNFIK
ncbi:MAG: hypothetical protein CME71_04665 [Halobacteriovorax sp.]|nr:hypothetical protein [Halobacteriovorax sp.]|tara:strand:+ start:492 stop:953 length:462 start_codon:yes stop_codon:yes gene_type:complete